MSEVVRILVTAALALPFLGVAAAIEAALFDSGLFTLLAGAAIWAIIICGGIVAFDYLTLLWS